MKVSEYHDKILESINYPPEEKNGDYQILSNGGFTIKQLEYLLNWIKNQVKN